MKKLLVPGLLLAASFLLSGCKEESKTKGSDKTIYSCTMHHQIREYRDGQCPICGMDLVVVPDINDW